jgi:5-methylthioribose kinase
MTTPAYPILDAAAVPGYVRSRAGLAALVGEVEDVVECGEGKINAVFIVNGSAGALVLKQGLPWVRILPDWPLTAERVAREAALIERWGAFGENLVPRSFGYDAEARVLAMEYLDGHRLWRDALQDGDVQPEAARALGRLLARVAFHTSPLSLDALEHERRAAEAPNGEMTRLMEDVVFTIPFADDARNTQEPELLALGRRYRADEPLIAAVDELSYEFRTRQEALIHGDLHTGSVMVRDGVPRAIDAEFGRYGPIAWDIGELCAHFRIAAAALAAAGDTDAADAARGLGGVCWDSFAAELDTLWRGSGFSAGFRERWLEQTRTLAGRFSGVEVLRRIVGIGAAEELMHLPPDEQARIAAPLLEEARDAACGGLAWI